MSWLWGKSSKAEEEEKLVEEENESIGETLQQDSSIVSEIDRNDDDSAGNDVGKPQGERDNESDEEQAKDDIIYNDDEESSDESSLENTSDSEDEDDDSLVVDLIESMSTEDETSDDDISINEEKPSTEAYQDNPTNKGDDVENDDPVASFWEKQSLLVLAAEHDRVDILKALLKDENEEKETLLNSGIPPLHLAISFGSVNTAQSLLRMGADPSVRPNIDEVLEQRKNQPEDSKVDIPNIQRFEMITAWELAFGNALYEEKVASKKDSAAWSMFGSTTPAESDGTSSTNQIVKPVDMAPSKREGIRHAFTAEALRSVGSDEVDRLKQLVYSGMPANIDIGGKDLYGWAVEMGALTCEEFLRPVEAAKYDEKEDVGGENQTHSTGSSGPEASEIGENGDMHARSTKHPEVNEKSSSFVVHRPDAEETIPQLKNRLDELDSLAMALSVCLDNLAEEVSVCHGLLLMGGGASALASHVRSLRDLKAQKLSEMEDAQLECLDAERELDDLVQSTDQIGKEIADMANTNFLAGGETGMNNDDSADDLKEKQENGMQKLNIKAQIAASENKIRKLRASIADLSEENTRDLKEVKRRGLEGGINLVRGLREELRDLDFHLSEARSMKTACKAKISMILARVQNQDDKKQSAKVDSDSANTKIKSKKQSDNNIVAVPDETADVKKSIVTNRDVDEDAINEVEEVKSEEVHKSPMQEIVKQNDSKTPTATPAPILRDEKSQDSKPNDDRNSTKKINNSTKIATGDSTAIAIIQPGNQGFFTVDLWEVLLRIIGYERAANRRSVQNATRTTSSSRPNVMII